MQGTEKGGRVSDITKEQAAWLLAELEVAAFCHIPVTRVWDYEAHDADCPMGQAMRDMVWETAAAHARQPARRPLLN
jgi:hypothetical protein